MFNWIANKKPFSLTTDQEEWPLGLDFSLPPGMSVLLSGKPKTDHDTGLNQSMEITPLMLDEHELALG